MIYRLCTCGATCNWLSTECEGDVTTVGTHNNDWVHACAKHHDNETLPTGEKFSNYHIEAPPRTKLWKLEGCGGLMECVVRAESEKLARVLSSVKFGVEADWADTCVLVPADGLAEMIVQSDRRP